MTSASRQAGYEGFLVQEEALRLVSLAYPRALHLRKAQGAVAERAARAGTASVRC